MRVIAKRILDIAETITKAKCAEAISRHKSEALAVTVKPAVKITTDSTKPTNQESPVPTALSLSSPPACGWQES